MTGAPVPERLASAEPVVLADRLFQMIQLVRLGFESTFRIPPPDVVLWFPEIVQFVRASWDEETLNIAPPELAELPDNRQLVSVMAVTLLYRPPPLALAELPVSVQLLKETVASDATRSPPPLVLAELLEKEQLFKVIEPELAFIPPPLLAELSLKALFVRVKVQLDPDIPPPKLFAVLLENVQPVSATADS